MTVPIRRKPPIWYWIVAGVATLWNAAGLFAFYSDMMMSADALAKLPEYDRSLRAAIPDWLQWVYGVATWAGFLGGIGLLLRRRSALLLFLLSLIAVMVQFGYMLLAADIVPVKGVGAVIFPAIVAILAAAQLWFARHAIARGWIL